MFISAGMLSATIFKSIFEFRIWIPNVYIQYIDVSVICNFSNQTLERHCETLLCYANITYLHSIPTYM